MGTQTSFSINFGSKLSFIVSFLLPCAPFGIRGHHHQTRNWEWKYYTTKQLGPKLVFPPILVVNWASLCRSFFACAPPLLHNTILTIPYLYYNDTRTSLVHLMLNFSISYCDLIKFPYFADTTVRGDWGESTGDKVWKRGWRQGDFRDKSHERTKNIEYILCSHYYNINRHNWKWIHDLLHNNVFNSCLGIINKKKLFDMN